MSRTEVLKRVQGKIRLMHYALSTEYAYCHWIGRYYDFCLSLPPAMPSERKAEAFLTDMAVRLHVAAKTQNQAFSAVLFLYKEIMEKPLGDVNALRAKKPFHERIAPSRDQVKQLRAVVKNTPLTPVSLIVDLLYGCGMRVSEPLELRIKDVLWDAKPSGQLVIRGAKGGKDRLVPIPLSCIAPLKAQMDRAKAIWNEDRLKAPTVGVPLPGRLAIKYPSAPFLWQWFWVFPAGDHCNDPWRNIPVRYHILPDCIQRGVQNAARKIGMEGLITPHVLRHAYATHSRESLDALRVLLGHSSIETTAGYLHPVVDKATNPLDDLLN